MIYEPMIWDIWWKLKRQVIVPGLGPKFDQGGGGMGFGWILHGEIWQLGFNIFR
jgi:hypothetical protein